MTKLSNHFCWGKKSHSREVVIQPL